MAKPDAGDWQKLIRLGRYLKGSPRCVLEYQWQESDNVPKGYSDSDWAWGRATGKSTVGVVMMLGSHLVKSWSRAQNSELCRGGVSHLRPVGCGIARHSQYVARVGADSRRKD